MDKNLLVLSGGKEAIEGIKIAKNMGLRVIVCDGNKNAPGRAFADDFILVNIYNTEDVLAAVAKYPDKDKIDGVITIASDAVRPVAAVAEYLDLPGITKEAAFISTEKFEMKKCFKNASVPIPKFTDVNSVDELKAEFEKFGDAVLKPVDNRGARGVLRLNKESDLEWAFNYSMKFSASKKLIMEEWISGAQISTESVVVDGKSYLCGVADRDYSKLDDTFPYIVEDGGETPSKYSPELNDKLEAILDSAAKAVGISNGVLKGDIVLKNGEPHIIEVAARLSGGFFSTITIPLVYKINLIEMAVSIALGLDITLPKKLTSYCVQANRFLFLKPGTVKKVSVPTVNTLPSWVKYFEVNVKEGELIPDIENHTMRKGSVMVSGNTCEEAVTRVKSIINSINVEIN